MKEARDAEHYLRAVDKIVVKAFTKRGKLDGPRVYFFLGGTDDYVVMDPREMTPSKDEMNAVLRDFVATYHSIDGPQRDITASVFAAECYMAPADVGPNLDIRHAREAARSIRGPVRDLPGSRDGITLIAEAKMLGGRIDRASGSRFCRPEHRTVGELHVMHVADEDAVASENFRQLGFLILPGGAT